jgi:hypothetical protein
MAAEIIDIEDAKFRLTLEQIVGILAERMPEEYRRVPPALMCEVLVEVVREIFIEERAAAAEPEPMSLRQIGRVLAADSKRPKPLTVERTRQIEKRALEKCRRSAKRLGLKGASAFFGKDVKLHQGIRRLR